MDFYTVATNSGSTEHYAVRGTEHRTLCGYAVASPGTGGRLCKRCSAKAEKMRADRERLEYATRAAETQDAVMSQAAPRESYESYARWAVGPVMTREQYEAKGERIAADAAAGKLSTNPYEWGRDARAEVEQPAPVREGKWDAVLRTTSRAGFNTVTDDVEQAEAEQPEPARVIHYGESRPLCGDLGKSGTECVVTTDLYSITCRECHEGVYRPVDAPEPKRMHTDIRATTVHDERITYASVPSGDPVQVARYVALATRSGAFTDITTVELPGTVDARAVNGHVMTYRVIGCDVDDRPKLSQWDASHSDTCRCTADGEEY